MGLCCSQTLPCCSNEVHNDKVWSSDANQSLLCYEHGVTPCSWATSKHPRPYMHLVDNINISATQHMTLWALTAKRLHHNILVPLCLCALLYHHTKLHTKGYTLVVFASWMTLNNKRLLHMQIYNRQSRAGSFPLTQACARDGVEV